MLSNYRQMFIIIGLIITGLGFQTSSVVMACGGRASYPTFEELVDGTELIVEAVPIEVDDAGQNAIIRVEQYIKGQGEGYLLIYRSDPQFTSSQIEYPPGTCYWLYSKLEQGDRYIMLLTRTETGGYHATRTYHFPTTNATIIHRLEDEETGYTEHEYTYAQLADMLNNLSADDLYIPPYDYSYPRKHLLKIETESGTRYHLPIDDAPPMVIDPTGNYFQQQFPFNEPACDTCLVYSPNGADAGHVNDGHIRVLKPYHIGDFVINGEAILFSPNSRYAVVWNDDQLQIIPLRSDEIDNMLVAPFKHSADVDLLSNAVWVSDDILVYGDADGIWRWEITYTNTRSLLAHAENSAHIIDVITPDNRYVIYRSVDDEAHTLMDIQTGDRYMIHANYDIYMGLENRFLVQWYPSETDNTTIVEYCDFPTRYWDKLNCKEADIIGRIDDLIVRQVQILDGNTYGIVTCTRENSDICNYTEYDVAQGYIYDSRRFGQALGFALSPDGDDLALIRTPYILEINGEHVDLTGLIDRPITSISWSSSLFYEKP